MKKSLFSCSLLLIACIFSTTVNAQTNIQKAQRDINSISFTDDKGSSHSFTSEEYDSVRVLTEINTGVKVYIEDEYSYDFIAHDLTIEEPADDTNGNANRNSRSPYYNPAKKMWKLEWPHIKENSSQSWLLKVSDGMDSYSVEWDNSKIANRFTCYQMYDPIYNWNVSRTDDFQEDSELPAATRSRLSDYSGSGFSRGHLCPAADRRYSTAMVKQTCLLSNMQPQYQNHNGGQWATLEGYVRNWAQNYDTLYVVKAATIDDVKIDGVTQTGLRTEKCNNRLLVPKYFYMALLGYKKASNTYTAVGIWTYHFSNSESQQPVEYMSIDALEERTGIDFFCNLPDDIENAVEATYTSSDW